MDILGIFIGLGLFLIYGVFFASTINSLYGGGFVISREWWVMIIGNFAKQPLRVGLKLFL